MTGGAIRYAIARRLAPIVLACPLVSLARAEAPAESRAAEARPPSDRLNRRLDLAASRRGRSPRTSAERPSEPGFTGEKTLTSTGAEAGDLDRPNILGPLLAPINPTHRKPRRPDEE